MIIIIFKLPKTTKSLWPLIIIIIIQPAAGAAAAAADDKFILLLSHCASFFLLLSSIIDYVNFRGHLISFGALEWLRISKRETGKRQKKSNHRCYLSMVRDIIFLMFKWFEDDMANFIDQLNFHRIHRIWWEN